MAGGKHRWVATDDRGNGRMTFEFVVKKPADMLPIPVSRVLETAVQEKISTVQW
jgi:hypothetical protein